MVVDRNFAFLLIILIVLVYFGVKALLELWIAHRERMEITHTTYHPDGTTTVKTLTKKD